MEIYLVLYVDDMLLAGINLSELNEIKAQISNKFKMKDLGARRKILGMEIYINRSKGELFLCQ